MATNLKLDLIEEGIEALFKELGAVKTIKFFQSMGINRGDTLKEIESITKKLSKNEALELVKNSKL